MCFHLLTIFTGQGHISEIVAMPQISEGCSEILLEIIRLQMQLFARPLHHLLTAWCLRKFVPKIAQEQINAP